MRSYTGTRWNGFRKEVAQGSARYGQLPHGTDFKQLIGVGLLGGIGFTMSIFIGELAFTGNEDYLLMAKSGILFASLIAGISGLVWLYMNTSAPQKK